MGFLAPLNSFNSEGSCHANESFNIASLAGETGKSTVLLLVR